MKKTLFLFSLILALTACEGNFKKDKGVFNLTNHDFSSRPIVDLDGEWEFYWKKLYAPGDFPVPDSREYIIVPRTWNVQKIGDRKLEGHGFGTYRATVLLPKNGDRQMELKIGEINSNWTLFVNRRLVLSKGKVGRSREESRPEWDNGLVTLNIEGNELEIIIQVSNYNFATGGIGYQSIRLGKTGSLTRVKQQRAALDIILFAILLILGFLNLLLFIARKKEQGSLWLAVVCFCFLISNFLTGERELYSLFFPNNFKAFTSLTHFSSRCGVMLILLFISSIFPGEVPRKILYPVVIFFSISTLLVIILPARIYSYSMNLNIILNSILGFYILSVLIRVTRKRKEGGPILLAAWILTMAFIGVEELGILGAMKLQELLPLGLTVFLLFHTILLASRFNKALADSEKLNESLITINSLKDDFLAKTSHELRTPLHAIMGITKSMLEAEELPRDNRSNLEIIFQSSRRLAFLVNDIIDFYKIKHSTLKLRLKPVNIHALANTVLSLVRFLRSSDKVKLINEIPQDLGAVYADEYRVQQILLNLTENSLKHTPEGSISIRGEKKDDTAFISVTDTGPGIPEELQKNIFKMFEEFDINEESRSSSGIGLAITKQLVELHNGRISLDSAPGKGTTVSFSLPLYKKEEGLIPADLQISKTTLDRRGKMIKGKREEIIMIVDDELSNILVLENYIKELGYSCRIELTGEEALAFIREKGDKVCLVLLDVTLPGKTGYQVCREIRDQYSLYVMPVLIVTARITTLDMEAGFEAGANDYLTKPFTREELIPRVKTLLKLQYVTHANTDLEKSSNLKQLFLSMLSHDMREPLFTLQMALDNLAREEKGGDMIKALYGETLYLSNLAERFLKLTQIENGNISCIKILLNPFKELEEIVKKNRIIAGRKKQEINYLPREEDIRIKADRDLFISIFNNIIGNAMKFSLSGEAIFLKSRVTGKPVPFFRVEVEDHGPGMHSLEERNLLKANALSPKPTGNEPSAGVGLYIVKYFVELHQGRLEMKNNPGPGMTVSVELPLHRQEENLLSD